MKLVTFDVYNTLVSYGKELVEEINDRITNYLRSVGVEARFDHVIETYLSIDREVRVGRVTEMSYVPPMENVRRLLERLFRRYGVGLSERVIMDVSEIIATTMLESKNIKPNEEAQSIFMDLKDEGFRLGIISNVIFWNSSVTRRLLDRFNLGRFIDVQVYADEVGRAKPHPLIFERTLSMLTHGIEPDMAIHVGDGFKEGLLGALLSDMVGVYVDRDERLTRGGSPVELIRCRAYAVRRLREVLLIPHMLSSC